MGNHSRKFSDTDIYILETGLRWIKEAPEAFADKLYHRLLRDHPEISASLQSISLQSFTRNFLWFLEAIIEELRTHRSIHISLDEYFSDHLLTHGNLLNAEQVTGIFEAYLEVFSEVAEDAWSPALESVWKKAIHEVSLNLSGQPSPSLSLAIIPSLVQVIKRREPRPARACLLFIGTLLMVAGNILSRRWCHRCRLPERKLLKAPLWKKPGPAESSLAPHHC